MVGNGFCNDETNNVDCNYDGGDCCFVNTNTNSCSECVCYFLETCEAGYHPLVGNGVCDDHTNVAGCYDGGECCSNSNMVGDGICNDEINNLECKFDDGDCCGYNINSEHCTECTCFHEETCVAGVHPLVGDDFCNNEVNIFECNYDDGDCCGPAISCK